MGKQTATEQIAAAIRQQVANGELAAGALLPSEIELAQQWDVSRTTARAALKVLEQEGAVAVLPRRGRIVRQRFRVFLSTPMAALAEEDYETDHSAARKLYDTLIRLAPPVYWAGAAVPATKSFEAPDIATEKNVTALTTASAFVYLQQRELTHPTSSLIELGMALAAKKPVTVFAPTEETLPYMLRRFEATSSDLGLGRFRVYGAGSVDEVIRLLTIHGIELIGLDSTEDNG